MGHALKANLNGFLRVMQISQAVCFLFHSVMIACLERAIGLDKETY